MCCIDLWDFNQTVDFEDEFAHGLSFSSLTPSLLPSQVTQTDARPSLSGGPTLTAMERGTSPPGLAAPAAESATSQQPVQAQEVSHVADSTHEPRQVVPGPSLSPEPRVESHALRTESPSPDASTANVARARHRTDSRSTDSSASPAASAESAAIGLSLMSVDEEHFRVSPVPSPEHSSSEVTTSSSEMRSSDASMNRSSREEFEVISQEEAASVASAAESLTETGQSSTMDQVSNVLVAQGTYLKSWLSGSEQ